MKELPDLLQRNKELLDEVKKFSNFFSCKLLNFLFFLV